MPTDDHVIDALTRVLVRACRKLSDAGRPQDAARLAADGWVAVRHTHPRQAQHLDGIMHHIARVEARLGAEAARSGNDRTTERESPCQQTNASSTSVPRSPGAATS